MAVADSRAQCPVVHTTTGGWRNRDWWPNELNLKVLHHHSSQSNPMGEEFNYADAFKTLDLDALRQDVMELMTASQDWWPADFGHYGPLFIRMAWHSAGTYRIDDGRGGGGAGAQRFAPLNSWPDNVSLDKARRLLWPIKQKYGRKISWADLMIFTGNCALESMGFETFGFGGGREDIWEPEDVYWGPEQTWLGDERYSGDRELAGSSRRGADGPDLREPGGAERQPGSARRGPGHPRDVRAHGDERRGDGRADRRRPYVRQDPRRRQRGVHRSRARGAPARGAGLRLEELSFGNGNGADTWTSGLEGAWTATPVKWDNSFFDNLFNYEWELTKSPAGANQWTAKDASAQGTVPDAHDPSRSHAPVMLTTDLSLKVDPIYGPISRRFYENPDEFAEAFAKAWYKLTHRDMGPVSRYLGPLVPAEPQLWQDPVPAVDHELIDDADIAALKSKILASGLSVSELVATAWASAATFRGTDMRGGANGARIRLEPQKDWEVNGSVGSVVSRLETIQEEFNRSGGKKVSLADLIVLGGCAAVEQAAKDAGHAVAVPFAPGRTDATQEQTDADSFALLEPKADGFRNYLQAGQNSPMERLVERANLLTLTAPEMTVLVGGMRALGANFGQSPHGVFTYRPGTLTNDFFVNLLDMGTEWKESDSDENVFEGHDRVTGELRWTGTAVDLVFGSNSQLRAIAEVYACDDSMNSFVRDFVAAWDKVMSLDRFDLAYR